MAQYTLATMYEEGKGTAAHQERAAHYYELSAERAVPQAQFRLGRLLASHKESRADRVSACKWLMLAESSLQESSAIRETLRKSMSHDEISEAEREVDKWRIAHVGNPHP